MPRSRGFVAAGHPLTAEAGARVLRDGGNAVDAAIAAMLTSWTAEPLLSGPGAGGYLLVAGAGEAPALLDFFVEAPGRGADAAARCALNPVEVCFGDATQVFNGGPASCGTYGNPAGICEASRRWGTIPLAELAAPAARLAREGVELNAEQAYVFDLLHGLLLATPEGSALFAPGGALLREGDVFRWDELAGAIELLGAEGERPFYEGEVAAAVVDWVGSLGGTVTREDLAAYRPVLREPVRARYRGRDVLTNPPPNAGGILLALALQRLARTDGPPSLAEIVECMESVQAHRTPEFTNGLADPAYVHDFVSTHLGNTTHISVMDGDGRAASVTCTNGEGSGVVVPGTGLHLNNIMGEEDLSPAGFHLAPPGTRMPSMMAPTVVLGDGEVEVVLGSAGSNRIRSAILQVVVGVVDHGMSAGEAVSAPRVHFEEGIVFAEPGVPVEQLEGREIVQFREHNLFFGGAQAVERDPSTGALSGAGDPRRGGAAVEA
ncbi:MAG TPA: gamma-glutamyltransferase [Solirubrobacteraceae bacterium]|jgi:gamma-glutamyltranspeptidase/glutathione hydrolase|nr:gamma-glutamyltransferase [Solirubrobacteraceae bacterium]